MNLRLPAYPDTKDSGVEWLGQIPIHWDLTTVGRICTLGRGRVISREEIGDCVSGYPVYSSQTSNNGVMGYLPTFDFEGDYATWTTDGAHAGRVFYRTGKFNCTNVCGTMRSKENRISLPFIPYVLNLGTRYYVRYDINPKLMNGIMARIPIPVPSADEQAAIVRFLDALDRRVTRLLRDKRRLIALLNEQKQAVIQHAVTKGLNPAAPMKQSGVVWLGDIPAHWNVRQMRSLANIVRGGSPRPAGDPLLFHGDDEPWITVGEVTKSAGMYVTQTTTRLTKLGVQFSRTIEPGTLLLTNSGATLGIPRVSGIRGCINAGVAAFLNVKNFVTIEYLYFYWLTQTKNLMSWVNLGAQPNLNTQIIGGWAVPVPPTNEQEDIVRFLHKEMASIETVVQKTLREIDLIREYRTRLISDVVTGKSDVRDAVLPDVFPGAGDTAEEPVDSDVTNAEPEDDEIDDGADDETQDL